MMRKIRWGILLIGVIVLMAAMIQNSDSIPLKLFFYERTMPVSVLILATAVISFLAGAWTISRVHRRNAKEALLKERAEQQREKQKDKTVEVLS